MKLTWTTNADGEIETRVPTRYYGTETGEWHIWLNKRPNYCDRGQWLAHVDGLPSMDDQELWPRYYMDLDRAKAEIEAWVNKREEVTLAFDNASKAK